MDDADGYRNRVGWCHSGSRSGAPDILMVSQDAARGGRDPACRRTTRTPLRHPAASAKDGTMANDGARTTRLLITTRFVRSVGQGALAVDFTLYLRALHWSAVAISAVLSAALLVGWS